MRQRLVSFLRLWFVLGFSYVLLQIAFNLAVLNRFDLRSTWFQQALVVPLGQSVVYWLIVRRSHRNGTHSAPH